MNPFHCRQVSENGCLLNSEHTEQYVKRIPALNPDRITIPFEFRRQLGISALSPP